MQKLYFEKNQWLMYALPLVIFTCFMFAYWPAFQKLLKQWSGGDNSYCYLIVPLFLYLCWEKRHASHAGNGLEVIGNRKEQRAEGRDQGSGIRDQELGVRSQKPEEKGFRFWEFSWSLWGLIPIVLSVLLIIIGELGSVRALMFMGIWGCVVGLCMMLYGKRIRDLAFPLLILFFIVPLPPFVNQVLTFKLKIAASKLAVWMLRATNVSVVLEGNIIDIGVEKLQVADACSGLRYVMPMILMALLVAYFFVKGRRRWLVLLLMIVPLSIFINALRIWMSALFVVNGYPELAHNLFHDFSGWLMFMIVGAFLVALALVLKRVSARYAVGGKRLEVGGKDRNQHHQTSDLKPNAALGALPQTSIEAILKPDANQQGGWFKPILITVTLCLLFSGSGWALKQIPSSGSIPQRMSFEHFPMKIGDWYGKREYISQEILNGLWADDYVTARYFKPGSSNMMYLLIPFYTYQVTNHTAHAPQACILGGGFSLVRSKEHEIRVSSDKNIKIMTMILEKGSARLLGSYFFLQKGRVITSPWMNKFYLIWDGILKQRTDGALVRAEMTVASGQTMDAAYAELDDFIAKLWPILPDYIPD